MANTELQNDIFIKEMMDKRLENVDNENKFSYNDIQNISKNLNTSIFDENNCSIWTGYITKGQYVNFYFNKKKRILHRSLYINFKHELNEGDRIEFTCPNKGKCCNINHMKIKKCKIKKNTKNNKNDTNNIVCENDNDNTQTNKLNEQNDNNINTNISCNNVSNNTMCSPNNYKITKKISIFL